MIISVEVGNVVWRAYFNEHPDDYPEETAELWHIVILPRMMVRYNGAIYVRPLEAGRNGSDQEADIGEYTGKTVIVLLFAALAGLVWWIRQPSTVTEQQAAIRPFTVPLQEKGLLHLRARLMPSLLIHLSHLSRKSAREFFRCSSKQHHFHLTEEEIKNLAEMSGGYPLGMKDVVSRKLARSRNRIGIKK